MDYEKRVLELRAKSFTEEEMRIIIDNEAKDERQAKINSGPRQQSREEWLKERDNRPATEPQKKLMTKLGILIPDGMTVKQASQAIDEKNKAKKVT